MESLYELTILQNGKSAWTSLLHFLEIRFKMEYLHGLTPLHFVEIWLKMDNFHELTSLHFL